MKHQIQHLLFALAIPLRAALAVVFALPGCGAATLFAVTGAQKVAAASTWDDSFLDETTREECKQHRVLVGGLGLTSLNRNADGRPGLQPEFSSLLCGPAQADDKLELVLRSSTGSVVAQQDCVIGTTIGTGNESSNPGQLRCDFAKPAIFEPGLYRLDVVLGHSGKPETMGTGWFKAAWSLQQGRERHLVFRDDAKIDVAYIMRDASEAAGYVKVQTWIMPTKDVEVGARWFHDGQPFGDASVIGSFTARADLDEPLPIEVRRPGPKLDQITSRDGAWSIQLTFNGDLAKVISFTVAGSKIVPIAEQRAGAPNRLIAAPLVLAVERKPGFEAPKLAADEMVALRFHGVLTKTPPRIHAESDPFMKVVLVFQTGVVQRWADEQGKVAVIPKGTGVYATKLKETPDGHPIVFRTDEEVRIPLRGQARKKVSISVSATCEVPGEFALGDSAIDSFYSTQPSWIATVTNHQRDARRKQ